jgi:hypothetical protein
MTGTEHPNVGDSLRATENVLRDFIAAQLSRTFGQQWEERLGVSAERVEKWRDRRKEEAARLSTGNLETRLLYFADFRSQDDHHQTLGAIQRRIW